MIALPSCLDAITAARELLSESGLIFGRKSERFSHYFYRSDPPVTKLQFVHPFDRKMY